MRHGAKVVDATWRDRQVLQALLNDINGLSGTLADRGGTLIRLTADFNRLSAVINDNPDKVAQLLAQSGELSERVAATLQRQGGNLGAIIDGAGETAAVLNGQRRNIPVLLDSLNGFFWLLARIIRVPGPEGTLIAQARDTLPLDLCQILADVCPVLPRVPVFGPGTPRLLPGTPGEQP